MPAGKLFALDQQLEELEEGGARGEAKRGAAGGDVGDIAEGVFVDKGALRARSRKADLDRNMPKVTFDDFKSKLYEVGANCFP